MRNKIEKTHAKEKLITRTRQYLRGLAICLHQRSCKDFTIIREKYKCDCTVFLSLKKLHQQKRTLIIKVAFFISAHRIYNGLQNGPIFFSWGHCPCPRTPKRLVHEHYGLGLSTQVSIPWTKPQKISY